MRARIFSLQNTNTVYRRNLASLVLVALVFLHSQCHNAEQLYVWLLHFIANNYLIFSHKPDFLELSGQCVHFQPFSKKCPN